MSATAEKTLSSKCVKWKPRGWFHERIENSSGNGTADLVLSRNNIDVWLELKCCAMPKKGVIQLKHIRRGQIQWHRKKRAAGCTTYYLIQVGSGLKAEYYLVNSTYGPRLKDGVQYEELGLISICSTKDLGFALSRACTIVENHALDTIHRRRS